MTCPTGSFFLGVRALSILRALSIQRIYPFALFFHLDGYVIDLPTSLIERDFLTE